MTMRTKNWNPRLFVAGAAVAAAALMLMPAVAMAQTQALTVAKLKTMLAGGSSAARVLAAARTACIDFRITPAIEAELRAARAEAVLIEGLRSVCYRAVVAEGPPGRQPAARPAPARTTPARATPARTTPARTTPARTTPARTFPSVSRGVEAYGTLTTSDPTLSDGTYYDQWTFTARAGEHLLIDVGSTEFDTKLYVGRIVGGEWIELDYDDDGGEGTNSQLAFTPAATGEYVIRVQPYSTTLGRYTVRVGEAPLERAPQTRHASRGQVVTGVLDATDATLDDGKPYEHWVFSAQAGERLSFDLSATDFDTYLSVGEMSGSEYMELAYDDDSGEGTNSLLSDWSAPRSGEFIVRVRPYSSGTGSYTLAINSGASPVASVSGGPQTRYVTRGQTVNGVIDASDAALADGRSYEHWLFSAQAGERVTFDLRSSAFDTYLSVGEMRGSTYVELATDDDSGEGTNSLLSDWSAPRSGEFVVRVRPYGTSGSGNYTLGISGGSTSVMTGGGRMIFDASNDECRNMSHTTSQRRDQPVAAFLLQPPSSGTITLTTENERPDPVMYVYSPAGLSWTLMANDDDSGEGLRPLVRLNAVSGQRYLVCLWSYGNETGTMTLQARYD
jgi:hypothetical protein